MKKWWLLIVFVLWLQALSGEVFLLGPGRRSSDIIAGALPGADKVLYRENVKVNGYSVRMEVSAVRGTLADIMGLLKKYLKSGQYQFSGDTLRFERPYSGQRIERFLLISSGEGKPLTCFRMLLPEKLPPPGRWPEKLPPLPAGAMVTSITEFSNGTVCGEFHNTGRPAYQLLRECDARLRGRGMAAAGNEISSSSGGKGDIYFDQKSIVLVNFSDSGRGFFLYRKR